MVERERIDYDTDSVKHYVRYDGWLESCINQYRKVNSAIRAHKRKQPFTYFTFCASNAIDVFMLEKAGLLKRDEETGQLNHVYFCEKDETEFEKIVNLIKSDEAGFKGDFKEIVLFEDDDTTRNKDELDIYSFVPDPATRRKFFYKELHNRFYKLFPLDVINLDIHGVFFPQREDKYSAMLRSLEKIFEWQGNRHPEDGHLCERFTLMLTTHLEEDVYRPDAVNEMKQVAAENISTYPEFSTAFEMKFGHTNPYELRAPDFPVFFSVTLPKLIAPIAKRHGWFGNHRKIYTYARSTHVGRPDYHMMSSVINYERLPDTRGNLPRWNQTSEDFEGKYVTEICNILIHKPVDVIQTLSSDPTKTAAVTEDLRSIVNYRDSFLAAGM